MPDFTDRDFKEYIGAAWPTYTRAFNAFEGDKDFWYRARPKIDDTEPTPPYLKTAGLDSYATFSDALYVRIFDKIDYCDVVVIEACTSLSNFNDKRSRYSASTRSLVLNVSRDWLLSKRKIKNSNKTISEHIGVVGNILNTDRHAVPVRGINVLYVLQDHHHYEIAERYFPEHHEYFIPWGRLNTTLHPGIKIFLRKLDLSDHFYQ